MGEGVVNPGLEWLDRSRAYGRKIRGLWSKVRQRRYAADIDVHPDTWADLDGLDWKGPYRKTFRFDGALIDHHHRAIHDAPGGRYGIGCALDLGIDGYLQQGDALKMYELARLTEGDALELGTHYGLSASIIASALAERDGAHLETVDLNARTTTVAAVNLMGRPGSDRVVFTVRDGAARMDELAAEGRRYSYIFVDHWHGYQATLDAANQLHRLLEPGGFVQFHDFVDSQNADGEHFYGVFQAVLDSVCLDGRFLFCGNYGCTGVFRFLH